jgi:WD domain, G-beta repeat
MHAILVHHTVVYQVQHRGLSLRILLPCQHGYGPAFLARGCTGEETLLRMSAEAWRPPAERLASASDDGSVRLWDAESGRSIGTPLLGHTAEVFSVSFSPNGKRLASAPADLSVRLWDAESGRPIGAPLLGHDGPRQPVWVGRKRLSRELLWRKRQPPQTFLGSGGEVLKFDDPFRENWPMILSHADDLLPCLAIGE